MARKKSSNFAGAAIADIDVSAATFRRVVENAAGDGALIFDKITGSHSEANTIVHDGSTGRGALLGIPVINQWIGRSLALTSPATKGNSGGLGDLWVAAAPFFLAAGETDLRVELSAFFQQAEVLNPYVRVCDASNVQVDQQPLIGIVQPGESDTLYTAHLSGLTPGWNLLFVGVDTTDVANVAVGTLHYLRARPRLSMRGQLGVGADRNETGAGLSAPAYDPTSQPYGVTTPAAAEGVAWRNFDATMFDDLQPIDAYTAAGLNRNLNGLYEYITGFPAGGNAAYTQEDQDGSGVADPSNPARVRFEAHSQALYGSDEPQIDFPVWCEAFGAFLAGGGGKFAVDLAEPPTIGCKDWYAPWPRVGAGTETPIRQAFMPMADFQSGISRLQCAVLLGSEHQGTADASAWTVKAKTSTGNATATPTDTDGTQKLWLAIVDAVPFTGDGNELVDIRLTRTGAKPGGADGIGEVCVLGAALAFVKP